MAGALSGAAASAALPSCASSSATVRCELVELLARAQQHRALHFELLARDQVELGQARLQHGLEVLLQFLAALAQAGRHQAAEAAGEVVEVVQVDHGAWLLRR